MRFAREERNEITVQMVVPSCRFIVVEIHTDCY